MGLKIGTKKKIKVENSKSEESYQLIIWWHYNLQPYYYLIPLSVLNKKFSKTLKDAHDRYIMQKIQPVAVLELRNLLFKDALGEWKKYQVTGNTLLEIKQRIYGVCVTGQLS